MARCEPVFILSGFLIAGILLDTKDSNNYFRSFYIKRALRILPVYLLTLTVVALLRQTSVGGVVVSLLFLVNYATALGVSNIYRPPWSLAVEEHFYLLWPLIIYKLKTRTVVVIAVALCVIEPFLRYFSARWGIGDPHESTHLIADYLAFGALLAIFCRSSQGTRTNCGVLGAGMVIFGLLSLIAGLPHGILHRDNSFGDAFQVIPFNFMFGGTLILLLALRWRVFAGPWFWPLRLLGDVSYGLYLYHLLIFSGVYAMLHRLGWMVQPGNFVQLLGRFTLMFAISLAVSVVSRRTFEQWFLDRKKHIAGLTRE